MERRVVVTGMGAVTPVGNSVEEFWSSVLDEKHGFTPITHFDASDFVCRIAAEVKDFAPENYMRKRDAMRMSRFCQYAVAAAKEACEDSGLDMTKEDPYMAGCMISSACGSVDDAAESYQICMESGEKYVPPMTLLFSIANMASANVSITLGLKGKNLCISSACAAGNNSLGEAFRSIRYGEADLVFAGGSEGSVSVGGIMGFDALEALSTVPDPDRCCRPFDKDRSGQVLGEGAAIVVLEELEHAKKRGAHIYAEVVGYGATSDAYHITRPAPDGKSAARAMLNAVRDAGIELEDITYINAHGTGTRYNDLCETRAIKEVFGKHAYRLKVNSTKSIVGHMLGAAGAIEFIDSVLEINNSYIHRTLGFQKSEEEMDLNYCPHAYKEEIPYVLSNSFGFGGHNACIVLKKYIHRNK